MRGTYIGHGRMLVHTCSNGRLLVRSDDLSMGPELIISGTHEPPLTRYFARSVRPGQTVFDVGAHVGYFTVMLAGMVGSTGHVVAFEANPDSYEVLYDNLSINYLHDVVTAHPHAAHSAERTLEFHACRRFAGNSSVHSHDSEYFRHYRDEVASIQVPAVRLGPEIERAAPVDWLKIDIEGGEYHAFLGMQDQLRSRAVRAVVFELNRGMLQDDFVRFAGLLRALEEEGRSFSTIGVDGATSPVTLETLLAVGSHPHVLLL